MNIKLRIPLFVLTLGIVSSIIDLMSLQNTLIRTLIFYLFVLIVIYVSERTKIGDKDINVFVGLFIIIFALLVEYLTHIWM